MATAMDAGCSDALMGGGAVEIAAMVIPALLPVTAGGCCESGSISATVTNGNPSPAMNQSSQRLFGCVAAGEGL